MGTSLIVLPQSSLCSVHVHLLLLLISARIICNVSRKLGKLTQIWNNQFSHFPPYQGNTFLFLSFTCSSKEGINDKITTLKEMKIYNLGMKLSMGRCPHGNMNFWTEFKVLMKGSFQFHHSNKLWAKVCWEWANAARDACFLFVVNSSCPRENVW